MYGVREGYMNVKCVKIEVIKVDFERNINFPKEKKEIPIQLQSEYATSKNPEDKSARLILHLKIAEDTKEYPFYCGLDVAGFFEWSEMEEKEVKKEIEEQGSEILFSFIRTYVYDLMQNSGMEPFILPIEHFDTRQEV